MPLQHPSEAAALVLCWLVPEVMCASGVSGAVDVLIIQQRTVCVQSRRSVNRSVGLASSRQRDVHGAGEINGLNTCALSRWRVGRNCAAVTSDRCVCLSLRASPDRPSRVETYLPLRLIAQCRRREPSSAVALRLGRSQRWTRTTGHGNHPALRGTLSRAHPTQVSATRYPVQ